MAFTDFGVGPASVFYIGNRKYPVREIFGANIFVKTLSIVVVVGSGVFLISFFSSSLFPGVPTKYLYLSLLLIPLQFSLTMSISLLQGLNKINKYNVAQFVSSFTLLSIMLVLLFSNCLAVGTAILAQIGSYLLASIVALYYTNREINGFTISLNTQLYRDLFSYGVKNYVSNIFSFLQYRINTILVNLFMNPIAVGYYAIAVSMSEQTWIVADSASTVLFPRVASETDEKKLKELTPMVSRNVMFVVFLMVIVLFAAGNILITTLYTDEFVSSIRPFRILLLGVVAISGWRILANDFCGRGRPMINTYMTGSVVVFSVILNVMLIPIFGIEGAALATTTTYFTALVVCAIVYSKISGNRLIDIILIRKSDWVMYKSIFMGLKEKLVRR